MNLATTLELYAERALEGRTVFQGLPISIEHRVGSVREGKDPNGERWKTVFRVPYGYIRKTEGVDGDHVDVFVGPWKNSDRVFVVHMKKPPDFKSYDEDKVHVGFRSAKDVKRNILQHYDDKRFLGPIDEMSMGEFKKKAFATKDHPQKIAAAWELSLKAVQ